jgi:hypothetical protein
VKPPWTRINKNQLIFIFDFNKWGKRDVLIGFWLEDVRKEDTLEESGLDGRIILK